MPRIDLNRMRKVYPSKKKQPHWFNQSNEVETKTISFSGSAMETVAIGVYNYPVIVIGQNDNINAWISKVYREVLNGPWRVDVSTSAAFTGEIHLHIAEGNP